jgi:hypothetical protein
MTRCILEREEMVNKKSSKDWGKSKLALHVYKINNNNNL